MKDRVYILALLFSVLLIIENFIFYDFIKETEYLYEHKGLIKAGFYLFCTLLGAVAIAITLLIKNRAVFISFFSIFTLSYLIFMIYKDINGYGFGLNELNVAYTEAGKFTSDVWSAYSSYLYNNLLLLLVPLLGVYLFRKFLSKKQEYYFSTLSVVIVLTLTFGSSYAIVHKTTNSTSPSPIPIKIVNTVAYFMANSIYYGDREEPKISPVLDTKYKNIIWIIDESVGGKYLSINGYSKETTPYLASISDSYLNLGIASSGANCSAESNIILMSGMQLEQLPDSEFRALKGATIFQYAKRAGYKTHYISGQSENSTLQNFMTKFDLDDIDSFFQPTGEFEDESTPEKNIIEKTYEALNGADKNFIYIVKKGSHFHWESSYPKSHQIFKPTLSALDNLVYENRDKALNSYANSIRYGVDLFFKKFFERTKTLNREDTLIIYTSDHGQSILESKDSPSTHCDSTNPSPSQGVVPLLIFREKSDKNFQANNFSKDIYSHYQIFSSTLMLMGYRDYPNGSSFFKPKNREQSFFSGDIFGRASYTKTNIEPKMLQK